MIPFKVSAPLKALNEVYPDARRILQIAKDGGESARSALARLWLSEGIPYAFKECPGIYESLRTFIGERIGVDPKDISLTGSARLGQSLAPNKLGSVFNENSDLDIFIISNDLFERLRSDFNSWSFDFESSKVSPSNDREKSFWTSNYDRGQKNISKGFIDSKIIPNYSQYQTTQNIAQTMWMVKEKLGVTENAPKVSQASVRCYRSWSDYVRQVSLSLI